MANLQQQKKNGGGRVIIIDCIELDYNRWQRMKQSINAKKGRD